MPFDGPYVSMVVPAVPEKAFHRFQVVVQNVSSAPRAVGFKLHNLPFLATRYLPARATVVPAGMEVVFEMAAYVHKPGDYVPPRDGNPPAEPSAGATRGGCLTCAAMGADGRRAGDRRQVPDGAQQVPRVPPRPLRGRGRPRRRAGAGGPAGHL